MLCSVSVIKCQIVVVHINFLPIYRKNKCKKPSIFENGICTKVLVKSFKKDDHCRKSKRIVKIEVDPEIRNIST